MKSDRSSNTTLKVGDIQLNLVSDGVTWVDGGGAFGLVPRALWIRVIKSDEHNRVPMILNCLLILAGGRTILVDTGLGDKLTPKDERVWGIERPEGGLVAALQRAGVAREDVDIVVNTHLHSDHCGGNTTLQDGKIVLAFPNAEYWVQRLEYADAAFPNERTRATYLPENFTALYENGQMRLIDGETEVAPGVRCVVTPGHTRAHQSVVIEQDGQAALYTGDMSTYAIHFARLAWLTAYDVEPLINLETKRSWQRWALAHQALILFPHDVGLPVGRLVESENGSPQIVEA
jgi:glyoxylase-like metal-dependent hydrolase (beta-lactamase superfamily II)